MTTQKYPSAIFVCIFGLVVLLGLGTYCAHAADPVITTALDEIGSKYSADTDGVVWLSYDVRGEDVTFYIQNISEDNRLKFTCVIKEGGVLALQCLVGLECRGDALKTALLAFVTSVANFRAAQATSAKKSGLPETASTSNANTDSSLTDFNAIPVQYREADSKVKAWLKQEGYYGKTVSFKAHVRMVFDQSVLFEFKYAEKKPMGNNLSFDVFPPSFSPLDYNEGDSYIVSGQIVENDLGVGAFSLSNAKLQRIE